MSGNEYSQQALNDLIRAEIVPADGNFAIDEHMLYSFIRLYNMHRGGSMLKFNWMLARKLAGLSLLKHKLSNGTKHSKCKEGLVYQIKNPAWPDYTKIGITVDLNSRLDSYQTSDPFRSYKVECYEFVLNRKETEKNILNKFDVNLRQGEWVRTANSIAIFAETRNQIKLVAEQYNPYKIGSNRVIPV